MTYIQSKHTLTDINGTPYFEHPTVNTIVPGKEYEVHYTTGHSDPSLQAIYEEFKMSDNKPFYLSQNKTLLSKYNINVDNLIEIYTQ